MRFPIIPCHLCGSQDGLQRQNIKAMVNAWERAKPGRKRVMVKVFSRIGLSELGAAYALRRGAVEDC